MTKQKAMQFFQKLMTRCKETDRLFEVEIVRFVNSPSGCADREVFEAILSDCEVDDMVRFCAFCALFNLARRRMDVTRQGNLLAKYSEEFEERHPFFSHLRLLSLSESGVRGREAEILIAAKRNAKILADNCGTLNALASAIAAIHEESDYILDSDDITLAKHSIEKALEIDPTYAKFYATMARVLMIEGKYDSSISLLRRAIDLEDSSNNDYAIRIGKYQFYILQAKEGRRMHEFGERITAFNEDLELRQKTLTENTEAAIKRIDASLLKNVEFLGLFAAITIFSLGAVQISIALAGISFLKAGALIIVLMGSILVVFSGFGIILHGLEKGKRSRNVVVMLLGFVFIGIGLLSYV